MDRDTFKMIHSELIQQVQCIEYNLKTIYAAMHKGDFEKNFQNLEKANLGKITRELYNLDHSDDLPDLSENDYRVIDDIRNMSYEDLCDRYKSTNLQPKQENSPEQEALNRAIIDAAIAHAKILNPDVKIEEIPSLLKQPIKSDIVLENKKDILLLIIKWAKKFNIGYFSDIEKLQKYEFSSDCLQETDLNYFLNKAIKNYEELHGIAQEKS